ncbi:MAG: hypothetical protein U0270_28320 [Labilithrix sp.]
MGTSRSRRKDTELAIGDLVAWKTEHGTVLVWILQVLAQSGGAVPLLEVLDDVVEDVPADTRELRAAVGPASQKGRLWYVGSDLREATDPRGRYARVARGFERAGFVPSRDSEHGLLAPWLDTSRLASELERFAFAKTSAGRAQARAAASASARDEEERARARAAARSEAKALLTRRVEPREMPKPKEAGARRFVLGLTGRASHAVWFAPGVGNMSIGPSPPKMRVTPHALVGEGEVLFWDGLDELPKTGGGSAMPRWLDYEGSDAGIFAWLGRRESPLERLVLVPTRAIDADARRARIGDLVIDTRHRAPLTLVLPATVQVTVRGDAALVRLTTPDGGPITPRAPAAPPAPAAATFAGWSITKRGLAIANAALVTARRALDELPRANAKKAKAIVFAFVDALNELHATKNNTLLTAEREDVATAIDALFAPPKLEALAEDAREWLAERRDF